MFSLMLRPACGGAAATTAAKSGGGGCGGGHGSKRAHGSRTSIIGSPGSSTSSAASVFRSHAILVASSALGSSARVGQTRSSPTSWAPRGQATRHTPAAGVAGQVARASAAVQGCYTRKRAMSGLHHADMVLVAACSKRGGPAGLCPVCLCRDQVQAAVLQGQGFKDLDLAAS